jgi:phosphate starvation-inducible PhoH-like protein
MGKAKKPVSSKSKKEDLVKQDIFLDFKIHQKFHLNDRHKEFVEKSLHADTNLIFCDGFAGTAKSYLAVYVALQLLKDKKVERIVYVRSIVESADRKMGSLPGEVGEKFHPWSIPFLEKSDELIGKHLSNQLLDAEYVECTPVNLLRGVTFDNTVVIADEAQNCTAGEILTILTRFGKNCKMFVIGDSLQSDIPKSGFIDYHKAFDTEECQNEGVFCFRFTEEDITRSKFLRFIVKVTNEMKKNKVLSKQQSLLLEKHKDAKDWTPPLIP